VLYAKLWLLINRHQHSKRSPDGASEKSGTEIDLVRHVDYIHWNPVKHGLVSGVRDWPHSSFHRYVRMGWLAED
jgi:REP element-mobilizing transposase RayT